MIKIINLKTNKDITKSCITKPLSKPQVKLRIAKYRRLENKKRGKRKR